MFLWKEAELVSEIPILQSRRNRKKKKVAVNTRTLAYVIFQISIVSIILLLPVFSQSLGVHMSTLLALGTLFLFGGLIVYLALRLVMMVSDWMGSGKHTKGRNSGAYSDKISFLSGLKRVLLISAWIFVLKLWHPFIVAMIWWQGYKLMEGKVFSLAEVKTMVIMIQCMTYFAMGVFVLLLSQPYWGYKEKLREEGTDLTVPIPTGEKTVFASVGE